MRTGSGEATAAGRRLVWVVFLVSGAVLAFEIALMRVLLVASWHHFAFLVISVVLLGFGASGTALLISRSWVVPRGERVLFGLALGTAVSMPICCALAQHVPIETRFAPALLLAQLGAWLLYWGILTVPFFLGAAVVGLALMLGTGRVGVVYGANLIGSAAGAILAPVAMSVVAPAWLSVLAAAVAFLGAAGAGVGSMKRSLALAGCLVFVAGWLVVDPPRVRVDTYKRGAEMTRLSDQGSVERVARTFGPRAVVEAYRGEVLHDFPFLSAERAPPPVTLLLADGHTNGSLLEVAAADEAAVVEGALMAFPYAFLPPHPRVALLGETGGANIWLAARHEASAIDVVQPDENLVEMMRGPLRAWGGHVLDLPEVFVHISEPRHFVEHVRDRFDLIQLAALESSAAGSGGVGGLGQNHLVTVAGIVACLERLGVDGLLAVSRGIQDPPRDNLKLLATFLPFCETGLS